jgi:ABC-type multidrug transport system fused ATPase/permease subunit
MAQFIRHPLYRLSQRSRKAASAINVHLQHNVSGIALLRLFGLEEADNKKFTKLLNEQLKWNVAASALQGGVAPFYVMVGTAGIILVVGMGGEYVVNGVWTIGMFTAYLSMFTAMATRANVAGRVMNTWHGAKASWDRICEKLTDRNDYVPQKTEHTGQTVSSEYNLDVRSLTFTYPFSGEPCLRNISFTANKGEIIGITGSVGSGKSALASALSGLFSYEGEIMIDGTHLYALNGLRSEKIAYMDSEHFVFSDDVDFNVTLDRKGDINNALSLAAMDGDIKGFENGIQTRLMERGLRISGGQRQRIALARAWYGNPQVLILDDPFSAIDVNMEQEIMNNIRANRGGRTVLLFSHRLAVFNTVDKIIVLDKGEVSQMGTHDELINEQGLYRDIYTAQEFIALAR